MIDPIQQEIHKYIQDELNDGQQFSPEADIIQQGLIDSMGVMKLLNFLEKRFHVEIELEMVTAENFQTVASIFRFLESRRKIEG